MNQVRDSLHSINVKMVATSMIIDFAMPTETVEEVKMRLSKNAKGIKMQTYFLVPNQENMFCHIR